MTQPDLIKSNQRVKDHGEVFTPEATVKFMLDQPGVKAASHDLAATFLEPSAGEGAFLVVLLARKLATARSQAQDAQSLGRLGLQGLASLYGIELLADNYARLTQNLRQQFVSWYTDACHDLGVDADRRIIKSATTIIAANMIWGNTLTHTTQHGSPIIFSEWTPHGTKVKRTEFFMDDMVNGINEPATHAPAAQLDLFADFGRDGTPTQPSQARSDFAECLWEQIYLEKRTN